MPTRVLLFKFQKISIPLSTVVMKKIAVFVFTRDLRVHDNSALQATIAASPNLPLLPIFVADPSRLSTKSNPYASDHSITFLKRSLYDLDVQLNHCLTIIESTDVSSALSKLPYDIATVGIGADVTPFARRRDESIKRWCDAHDARFVTTYDHLLISPEDTNVRTNNGDRYVVFTPFWTKLQTRHIRLPTETVLPQLIAIPKSKALKSKYLEQNMVSLKGKVFLQHAVFGRASYKTRRDALGDPQSTTHLSAFLKFGVVGVREAWHALADAKGTDIRRELAWREFYAHLAFHHPELLQGQVSAKPNAALRPIIDQKLPWDNDESKFARWCEGRTGFPIVDAGMRQLLATGFMHNRARMVVASFLIKDLRVDWRWGERFFASRLVDYDPCSNSGGWQWCAGVGADAQPFVRVFNPWLQAKKYDPDCKYVRRWVPELRGVPNADVMAWATACAKHPDIAYPAPMLDHATETRKTLAAFKTASS
jgi:deoxyribodipyrimidine photo-lyase